MFSQRMRVILSLVAVLVVAAMIFMFSAQEGDMSSKVSGRVTEYVLTVFVRGFRDMPAARRAAYMERWGHAIRKLAHFSEYALLAFTLTAFWHYLPGNRRLWQVALLAWLLATAYAGSDELHQMFVGGRAGMPMDVFIDCAGAATGTMAAILLIRLRAGLRAKREAKI